MTLTPKLSASTAAGGVSGSGWLTPYGRMGSAASLESLFPPSFLGVDSGRTFNGGTWHGGGGWDSSESPDRRAIFFTPEVGRQAASFAAAEDVIEGLEDGTFFLTDLRHALGSYEYNMRLTSSSVGYPGSLVNRYL